MVQSIFYLILAAFGLGLLVFIHELGHYFMARRVGMTVEAFGIGFGKPIKTWKHKGVDWHLNWLPFGGYVRIAGMEKKGHLEPYQIPDGFYGKKPWDRIKVAFMGPLVNIVFAFLAFTMIWAFGGREKPFSESTHLIGWVNPQSKLYESGIRPGDKITQFGGHAFEGFEDLLFASIVKDNHLELKGMEINYQTGQKTPFSLALDPSQDLTGIDPKTKTVGIISPARYLIYGYPLSQPNAMIPSGFPLDSSGILPKDRILSVDGQLIFSNRQLVEVVNEPKALLTVLREGETFVTRIPRLKISDLRLNDQEKAELDDWHHAAGLQDKVPQLFFVPYNLTHDCKVEKPYSYLDDDSEEHIFNKTDRRFLDVPLKAGDQIIAVDGAFVRDSVEFLSQLQNRRVHIIVARGEPLEPVSWKRADDSFDTELNWDALQSLTQSIGTPQALKSAGKYVLLNPVTPLLYKDLPLPVETRAKQEMDFMQMKKQIEKIKDSSQRLEATKFLEEDRKKLLLGISLQDRQVIFNPSPFKLFEGVVEQTWRTLKNLLSGQLSPKFMSGPIGIIQVMHYGWSQGIKDALFWMAVVSLNLGILNLFPLPVLDGGHICFSIFESFTKKRLKAKTMERLIIPFIVILVGFFIYCTYNDIIRLLGKMF